jgi:hypothetical protein
MAKLEIDANKLVRHDVTIRLAGVHILKYRMYLVRILMWMLGKVTRGQGRIDFDSTYDKEHPETRLSNDELRLRVCIAVDAYRDAVQRAATDRLIALEPWSQAAERLDKLQDAIDTARDDIIALFEELQNGH